MAEISPEQAIAGLQRVADTAQDTVQKEMVILAERSVPELRADSPVDTGAYRAGWDAERTRVGAAIVNRAEDASFVGDGLADRQVVAVTEQLEPATVDRINRDIEPEFGP